MSIELAIEKFYRDIWTRNDRNAVKALVSPDLNRALEMDDPTVLARGLPAFRELVRTWHVGFVDILETPIEVVSDGNRCMVLFRFTGRHVGSFAGRAATGRNVAMHGVDYLELSGDRIVNWRCVEDMNGLLAQISLGAE